MQLSAPIYVLKSQAKKLKSSEGITQAQALNTIAKREGYSSWSLLVSKSSEILPSCYSDILSYFNEGDLIIVAARAGMGKTSFTIGLFVQAIERNMPKAYFFTLAESHKGLASRIGSYNNLIGENNSRFSLNYSNDICSSYIIKLLANEQLKGSMIIIDYLQILDQKRSNPELQQQIIELKSFAKEKGCMIIFLSQISREIESRFDQRPTTSDIRLPNPLDLSLINKKLFIYRKNYLDSFAEVIIDGKESHSFKIGWDGKQIKFFDL